MSVQQTIQTTDLDALPADIASPRAKLVYLYLAVAHESTIDELCENLDLRKLAAFSILDSLSKKGLVDRDGDRYVLA